jgi:hypothetical protein
VERMQAMHDRSAGNPAAHADEFTATRVSIRGFAEKARFLAVSRVAQGVLFGRSL